MRFDERALRDELARMPARHRAAFAAFCAERMIPNYDRFHLASGWGDPSVLRRALDYAWAALSSHAAVEPNTVEKHVSACEAATPDMDEFGQVDFASAALDAGVATIGTLQCLASGEVDPAIEAATAARDTVDMYIQEVEDIDPADAELEERIIRHLLYQREMEQQNHALERLATAPGLTPEIVAQLRESASRAPSLPA